MAQKIIDIGIQGNDGTGDSIRESFRKVNENFTEMYAIFGAGGTINFTSLGDTPASYLGSQVIMASVLGDKLTARTLVEGNGIAIDKDSSNNTLTISATTQGLNSDPAQTGLAGHLNANTFAIGSLSDPTPAAAAQFESAFPTSLLTLPTGRTTQDQLAMTKGYADRHYVASFEGTIVDALKSRAQPIVPELDNPDYNPALTSNYLSTEVMQRKDVVYRGGDTMTGTLNLSDHPGAAAGVGTPNGSDDLQAATKYYVDNKTYSSNVNLYVSTSSGDDGQQRTPPGKEGRFWQYAYKTVGAAALQAENLINLASIEPGPYKQRIAYTVGPTQTQTTIQSVVLSGGNSGVAGYQDAADLLTLNKPFIQAETIAYLNKKYVNAIVINETLYTEIITKVIDGVCYDLVVGSDYNSITVASNLFEARYLAVITEQQTQVLDAIERIRNTILDYNYDSTATQNYVSAVLDALGYDIVFQGSFQTLQTGLAFSSYATGLSTDEITAVISNLGETLLTYPSVIASPNAIASITNNIALLNATIINSSITVNNNTFPDQTSTSNGLKNAKELLLTNIPFMQAEIVAFLQSNYPDVSYSKTTCQRDVKYIAWSLVYDLMYGGDQQSSYAGSQYRLNGQLQIQAYELEATLAAIGYINTLAQAVIINDPPALLYQTSFRQYSNETLVGGEEASASILANVATIQYVITNVGPAHTVTYPDITGTSLVLRTARTAFTSSGAKTTLKAAATTYINTNPNFSILNNPTVNAVVNLRFDAIESIIRLGAVTRTSPSYTYPSGLISGYRHAQAAINANVSFIVEDSYAFGIATNPSFVPYDGVVAFKRRLGYIAEALMYDITYGGNSATVAAAQAYWISNTSILSTSEQTITGSILNHLETVVTFIVANTSVTNPATGNYITTTGASGDGVHATITFPNQGSAPYANGQVITITGMTPSGYNGYWTVTDCTATSVSWASTATGSQTVAGKITKQVQNVAWTGGSSAPVGTLLNAVIDIIANNTSTTKIYPVLTSYDTDLASARTIIQSNRAMISTNIIAYLKATYKGGFNYNEATCYRDIGYIIDGMSIDIMTGGNYQTVTAGKSYYKNASAKAIAIGTQYSQTTDGITFAKTLALQVLNKTNATRYQLLVTQNFGIGLSPAAGAKTVLSNNMDTIISIINNGVGSAPAASFGSGIYTVTFSNGGNGYVDQGSPGSVHIIPGKILIGGTSNAGGVIVKYLPGNGPSADSIQVRLTKPGFFVQNEYLDFGETVKDLNITIFVESGIYYEDYPIRLPAQCSIKGDEFRRTIMRPLDRVSQSPWRKVFFYRDSIIDAMEVGVIDTSVDYRTSTTLALGGTTGKIIVTLGSGQAPNSWIGKVIQDNTAVTPGKAVIDSISGNTMNCSVIYPFASKVTYASGNWHLYGTKDYGRHYLTDPLDINSVAKNNKDIDVLLCNDATRISNMTFQGHGGFAMVLDPEGQIKTKSPYGQVCTSFTQSINAKSFRGGQFVDGFAGRLFGTITNIVDSGITITVTGSVNSGLDIRPPQVPCVFYVQGNRYQVNDIVSYDPTTYTVVLTLDVSTPFNPATIYTSGIFATEVGALTDELTYDLLFGSNYQSIKAGLNYLQPQNAKIGIKQLYLLSGINKLRDDANSRISNTTSKGIITARTSIITDIISQGFASIPAVTFPNPVGAVATAVNAKNILVANREFIRSEIVAWIATNFSTKAIYQYNAVKTSRDIGYILDALTYDLLYGGNSSTLDVAGFFWSGSTNEIIGQEEYYAAALSQLMNVIENVITNVSISTSLGNLLTQNISLTAASATEVATAKTLLSITIDYILDGNINNSVVGTTTSGSTTITSVSYNSALVNGRTITGIGIPNIPATTVVSYTPSTKVLVISQPATASTAHTKLVISGTTPTRTTPTIPTDSSYTQVKADRTTIVNAKTNIQTNVTAYLNAGAGLGINIEMGGNRSMLANDFAMINDLGYAIFTTNGGVSEQVSTFSYYCHTHYWANNGGQIRSVAGSNAHGDYALRATGYDVTELPDSVTLANDMVQTGRVYKQGSVAGLMTPTATTQALNIWMLGYDYAPPNNAELEIDHSLSGGVITRYLISTVEHTTITVGGQNVLKVNLSTAGSNSTVTTGLAYELYDGQLLTIRVNQNIKFNNIDNVKPTRPSTAVQYGENLADIYRIIAYSLVDSTGEALTSNVAILQSDSSFSYYKFNSDPTYITTADPQDPTKTQGSKVGDNKIAVLQISQQTTIDQINKGIYLTGWSGRVHRIISYTVPTFIATGQFSTYTTPLGVPTLTVTSVAGSIDIGDVLTGTGFTAGQYVTGVQLSGTGAITAVVTLSAVPSPIPTTGTITFGVAANGYLTIDPNPVHNNSADGTALNAMTYKSYAAGPSGSGYTAVTFERPFATSLPAVDSFLTVANNSNTAYNGTYQVRSVTSKTQVTVPSTTGLSVGMVVSSVAVGAYIPDSCIIQSIDDATHFTVSPAAWIPAGSSVSSTLVAYLSGLTITDGGTSYTTEVIALQGLPIITLSGGGATSQGIAVVVCSGGSITGVNIVSPGYGYTSIPSVTLSYGNATLTPVLSQSPTVTTVTTTGTNTTDVTLAYPTSPIISGTISATDNSTITMSASSISGTTLTVGTTGGTVVAGMVLTGGSIPSGTYIVSNILGSGNGSTWTINKTVTQSSTVITGVSNLVTVNSNTNLSAGMAITFSGTPFGNITASTFYVTKVISTNKIAISSTYGGTDFSVLASASGTMTWIASGFNLGLPIIVSAYSSKSGTGPYDVQFTIPTSSITNGSYYRLAGNSNSLYNGFWQCISATSSSATSITLRYTYDPGTYGTGTTTVTKEVTSATSTQIGISTPFSTTGAVTLRLGYPANTTGQITQRISTCRVTGHDLLDIGTGSYTTTNWPTVIYGNPVKDKQQSQEVLEEGVGRVFYVTTDQNGIFRVGRFFTVDQGTGSVTFSASIALSNLDGLGFKRGVVVSEFSTDPSMTNNASDTVPVQSAIRSYIDKRLGLDHGGSPVALNSLIGPGFMALNGSLAMKGNLNLANYPIINVGTASNATDATNKAYVDNAVVSYNSLYKLIDVTLTSNSTSNFLVYDGVASKWKNSSVTGDVVISLNTSTGVLTATIQANAIDNSKISSTAAIVQSKLSLAIAGTSSSSPTGTSAQIQAANGLSSFNSTTFTVTNGWVEVKTATSASTGITYGKIQYMSAGTLLGNRAVGAASPSEVTPAQVVSDAGGLVNSLFTSSGVVTITYDGNNFDNNTYPVIGITSSRAANNIVKTGSSGEVDVGYLKVGGYKSVSLTGAGATLTSTFTTPGTFDYMTALGTNAGNTVISTYGTLDTSNGTLKANLLTTDKVGATSGPGSGSASISGWWAVQASSQVDFSLGKLVSLSLDAGTETTDATIRGRWTLTGASRMQATYADLAEYYEGDKEYEPGTVLVFGGDAEVTTTTQINDTRSAGVVSTDPAYVMNHEQKGIRVCMALAGRVPCKVIGRVKKGDMLTTSATPGYAVKALTPTLGAVIGKALEDKDYGEAGVIQVAVGRV